MNPILDLLGIAMHVAGHLPDDPILALHNAIDWTAEATELPDWLPQFEQLITAMIKAQP